MKLKKDLWCWILFFGIMPSVAYSGVPQISDVNVTDVTPVSFSVVSVVNEPSTVNLQVFQGPGCLTAVPSFPFDATGVSKATVTGLDSASTFCYQIMATSKSTSETTQFPLSPAPVITETEVVRSLLSGSSLLPFANDVLYFPSYLPDLATPASGAVLILSVPGSSHPISALVGKGISSPYALADLNNLFSSLDRKTLNLQGGEVLTIKEIRGNSGGTLFHYRLVPRDINLAEVKPPDACFFADNDCSGEVDIADAQRCFNQFFRSAGDGDYNDDLDVAFVDENEVDIADCQAIFNRFGQTAPFVP